jgi:RNA polymerase sigma-70 factor (ECF subfamily)
LIVNPGNDADARLAQDLMEGRLEAFDAFVDHFRTRIFQYSFLMCGQREDAEEVAQDTLLSAFENFASLREAHKVRSWIFRIAKNACLMKRRRSVFAPQHELSLEQYLQGDESHGRTGHEIAGGYQSPDDAVYRQEMNEALTRAIQQLPANYRSVVLLRDMEELSTEETAEILDLGIDLVKQRLHRGRVALRKLLAQQLEGKEEVSHG